MLLIDILVEEHNRILEVAAHSDGTGTQNGDGVRQILNFAQ